MHPCGTTRMHVYELCFRAAAACLVNVMSGSLYAAWLIAMFDQVKGASMRW
jgi:hypothetical protein